MKRAIHCLPVFCCALLSCLLLLCSAAAGQRALPVDDVREAVLRYEFRTLAASEDPKGDLLYFIGFGKGTDPDDRFMSRFRSSPRVRKHSSGFVDRHATNYAMAAVKDRRTRKPGILFLIDDLRFYRPDATQVTASFFKGGRDAGSVRYVVVRRDGKWLVVHKRWLAIS